MSLSALPWLTRSEARPAARLKTCELAKHKSQQDETDLFIFIFFFVFLSWGPDPPPVLVFGSQRERIQRGKCRHSGTPGVCLGC